jgi:hypothetical protein
MIIFQQNGFMYNWMTFAIFIAKIFLNRNTDFLGSNHIWSQVRIPFPFFGGKKDNGEL